MRTSIMRYISRNKHIIRISPCIAALHVQPNLPWSHRCMMTSSNGKMETFSALLALCQENSPVTGEFPSQRPMTRRFDVILDLRLNKRLSKQSWGWWFETPSHPLWRHRNEQAIPIVPLKHPYWIWGNKSHESNMNRQTSNMRRTEFQN